MTVYVTEDWKRVVPEGSSEARYGVQEKDARRLGLIPDDGSEPEPEVMRSANLVDPQEEPVPAEQPERKEARKPADKSRRKPKTK